MREVSFAIKNIENEIKHSKIFDASLHEKEIKFPEVNTERVEIKLTEQQRLAIEKDREEFFKGE